MAIPVLTAKERALLSALNQGGVRYIIVGLSSALLQGATIVTQDIDLWVEDLGSEKFLNAVKTAGAVYIPPGIAGDNPPMLGPGEFRIFDIVIHMHGLESFEKEYAGAIEMQLSGITVKILPLDRIIKSKESTNRDKDRAALPALKASLAISKS